MPTLDPNRAAFARAEYRYEQASDAAVRTAMPGARTYELATSIATTAGGQARATEILARYKTAAQAYEVQVEGTDIADLSKWDGSPPVFTANFEAFASQSGNYLPVSVSIDWDTEVTTLEVRS